MYNRNYSSYDNNYGEKRIDPYNRNPYNRIETDKNNGNNIGGYSSPLKMSSNILMNQNKKERFQNENLTVNRISPIHFQYKSKFYDDGGIKYNEDKNYTIERERNNIHNYTEANSPQQFRNNNNFNQNNNQRNRTPEYSNYNNNRINYNTIDNQARGRYDNNNYGNNYRAQYNNENDHRYYLKDPTDYYKGEELDDGFKHYNPEDNHYNGSKYGGYIYNYY